MKVRQTALPGVTVVEPEVFGDPRGFFTETFNLKRYEDALDRRLEFVQDNLSRSGQGVVRGMHLQLNQPQAKLVRVVAGEVFDVALDVNRASDSFGSWVGELLSENNHRQLFIPEGYAHGFQVLSDYALFEYKCVGYYAPGDEGGVIWNDPDVGIEWPLRDAVVSEKDQALPSLAEFVAVS